MPFALLQIVCLPLVAAPVLLWVRPGRHRRPAWGVVIVLAYTSLLLAAAGFQVSGGGVLAEAYPLGPRFSSASSALTS